MLWKHSWEYTVSFCACDDTPARVLYFYFAFFKSVLTWKLKLNPRSRFSPSNAPYVSFQMSLLETCISTGILKPVKRFLCPEFSTKYVVFLFWSRKCLFNDLVVEIMFKSYINDACLNLSHQRNLKKKSTRGKWTKNQKPILATFQKRNEMWVMCHMERLHKRL